LAWGRFVCHIAHPLEQAAENLWFVVSHEKWKQEQKVEVIDRTIDLLGVIDGVLGRYFLAKNKEVLYLGEKQ